MVAKTMMGENHIGPGFIFLYLGARYIIILIVRNIIIIVITTFFIIIIILVRVDDLNNAPWIEGMYFIAAFIYAATILLYWSLRKR